MMALADDNAQRCSQMMGKQHGSRRRRVSLPDDIKRTIGIRVAEQHSKGRRVGDGDGGSTAVPDPVRLVKLRRAAQKDPLPLQLVELVRENSGFGNRGAIVI